MYNQIKVIYMKKFLHSGIISFTVILLMQIGVIASLIFWLNEYREYILGVTTLISAILLVYEINRPTEPAFKYAWILLITVLPVFGWLLYIYTHLNVVTNKISKKTQSIEEETLQYLVQDTEVLKETANTEIWGISGYLRNVAKCPTYKNTSVKYLSLGEEKFEKLKEELKRAEQFIFMEYFIVDVNSSMWLEILDILKDKVKQGVEVRLMYDAMGSIKGFPSEDIKQLEIEGIKCKTFKRVTPFLEKYQNNRDHRKILVIDGHTAFTGGINIADEYINVVERFGHWKDTAVMLKGEAVKSFTVMFLQMWNLSENETEDFGNYIIKSKMDSDGYVIPYCDSPIDDENVGERVYLDIINRAKNTVNIMTPYLVISHEMQEAIKYAVKRGVDVNIILPHIPDKGYTLWLARSYYTRLIKSGVKIFEYKKGFVHAKVTTADTNTAVVGTINYDYRSLYLNYECALLMYNVKEIENIEKDFEITQSRCIEITLDEHKKFNVFGRMFGMVLRWFAPLI